MHRRAASSLLAWLSLGIAGCVDGGNLFISAGAPIAGAVRGRITECGQAVPNVEVVIVIQQDLSEQARPVNTRIGPVTTARDGGYLIGASPSFAVPGPANLQLEVTSGGFIHEITGGTLEFRLGTPARDTARFDADLGTERGSC